MKKRKNFHNPYPKNSTSCLEHTLSKLNKLCQARRIRLTPQRQSVLELMLSAGKAMSAYDLLDQLKKIEPKAKPPTIYRALNFLIKQGFIHKVESLNSYIICPHFDNTQHISTLFICKNCHMIIEKHSAIIEQELQSLANIHHFLTKHTVLEIHGICNKC